MTEGNRESQARVRLTISGKVQGVFFRVATLEEASSLGLTGWVRNCPDGSVEVVAEGRRKQIEDLVSWCRHGPPRAEVHNFGIQWEDYKVEFDSFRISR